MAIPSRARAYASWGVRLALTGLIIGLVLRNVPLRSVGTALAQVDVKHAMIAAIAYAMALTLVETGRFLWAGRMLDEAQPSSWDWASAFLVSRPFGYILPASIGSEGVLWMRLKRSGWRHASCGFVVMANRMAGVALWAMAAALSLFLRPMLGHLLIKAPAWCAAPWSWGAVGVAGAVVTLAMPYVLRRWHGVPFRDGTVRPMAMVFVLSAASALVNAGGAWVACRFVHAPIPLDVAFGMMAFFNFAVTLPVSLGGFGVQEAIFIGVGLPMGYGMPALVAASALVHFFRLALATLGGAVGVRKWRDGLTAPPSGTIIRKAGRGA